MKKEIIRKYVKYLGMNTRVLRFEIMKSLVELKEKGIYEKSLNYHLKSMAGIVWYGQS